MGALTTLTAVKLHLGITDESDDALLTQLINEASDDIAGNCNRTLTRETRTAEKYIGDGSPDIYLELYPVESIASVTIDGLAVTDYELTAKSGRLFRENGWDYDATILVTYTGGYRLETVAAVTGPPAVAEIPRTMPYDLESACKLWVSAAYNSRGSEHLSEEAIGPLKSVFWPEQPAIKSITNKYRKICV
jgi:hypothetical protein